MTRPPEREFLNTSQADWLTLEEELGGDRDGIHNFEIHHTARYREASVCRPVLDEEMLRRDPSVAERIRWPEGRRFAAFLSHDVDGTREHCREQLARLIRTNADAATTVRDKLRALSAVIGLRHRRGRRDLLSPWLEAEKERGFTSTFFVFPTAVSARHPRDLMYHWDDLMPFEGGLQPIRAVFAQVAARGWEVGLHGSIESAHTTGLLEAQRLDVEQAVGAPVTSGRQHNLQFGAAVTPDLLAASGLRVDCTLGSNRSVFFRTGTSYPHRLWSVGGQAWLNVLEIPLILHDGALLRGDNMDLSPESALAFCRGVIARVAAVRGVVSLLWHPENLVKPGYYDLYCSLLDVLREEGAWGTSARNIADWWESSGNAALVDDARRRHFAAGRMA
ncbi:MAG: hypothetical protein IAE94_09450 [Chthoniobacterales bacterium]|nr:hypothetical protein [Chthoniobacterales bacterium]